MSNICAEFGHFHTIVNNYTPYFQECQENLQKIVDNFEKIG